MHKLLSGTICIRRLARKLVREAERSQFRARDLCTAKAVREEEDDGALIFPFEGCQVSNTGS